MLVKPQQTIPIQEIEYHGYKISIKREDLIHPEISGNKFWKLFHNVNDYLKEKISHPQIITFGGAYSNHISVVAAFGKIYNIPTLGIIRGEELQEPNLWNFTLQKAHENRMDFRFISRENYRDKNKIADQLQEEFPSALILPEGGTNPKAVLGIKNMLNDQTKEFDYLCAAVGTGGTLAGLSRFSQSEQKILGFAVVKDNSLENSILKNTGRNNFTLADASFGKYGKINEEVVRFINNFWKNYHIPLEPVYTGKMMKKLFELIDEKKLKKENKILAFHTGGLQGIVGANELLKRKKKETIQFIE